ncbi:MAG: DUF6240 domain-containing protein [Lachnospiraceae bacterium]|nr:DUF6240 domain-containing protein [Lachnospiraceae bacterium]
MQINDITNLEIGNNKDKATSIGIDMAGNFGKIATNQSNRHEDYTKIEKDTMGVINMSNSTYNNPNNTIMDELEEGLDADGNVSAASTLNQRNFNAIEELGFDSKDMDEKEFVDIADKIRIAMAKGGADISMMGDISDAAIKQSGAYEQLTKNALDKAQLPVDDKAVQDSVIALREVDEIKAQMTNVSSENANAGAKLSDETVKYMLSNELEPTIDNIYKASTHSTSMAASEPIDISGNTSSMEAQFKEIINQAGLEASEDNLKDCYWMISNRISVTPSQLNNLQELRSLSMDDMNNAVNTIVNAMAEGISPGNAFLAKGHLARAEAEAINQGIMEADADTIDKVIGNNEPITIGNVARQALSDSNSENADNAYNEMEAWNNMVAKFIGKEPSVNENANQGLNESSPNNGTPNVDAQTAAASGTAATNGTSAANDTQLQAVTYKKQLVEIQLMMSTEANFALLKRGTSIDTMQLNEYVNALEELEQQFLETMLGDKATPETVQNLADSMDAVNKSKKMPDYAIPLNAVSLTLRNYASISISYSEVTTQAAFSAKFTKVSDYYDASATEVRRDLGDSLAKAFNNVDNILNELEMELSEENRRAVRILGYNRMEITEESIKEVKATDLTVNRTIDSLKPAVVTEMIKSGFNPLDMTMDELLQSAQEITDKMDNTSEDEKFSEFLWKLEQENGITQEERDGFIGMFRLIHQINEADGAAIGMLINQGAEVTMRNLLTATRTAKHDNREYTVDDNFGGITGFNKDSLNIEQQIEMSIQSINMRNVEEKLTPYKLMQFNGEEQYMSLTPEQLSQRLGRMDSDGEIAQHEQQLSDAYNNLRREEVMRNYNADRKVIEYLEANDMPLTSNNISAITQLLSDRNSMMSTLFNRAAKRQVGLDRDGSYAAEVGMEIEDDSESLEDEIQDIIANLIHEYGESVKTPEDMAEAEQRLEEMAENVMKNMIVEEDVRSIDVRGMHLIQTEIKTLGEVSKRTENYTIPIMVADEVGNLSLKIVRGKEEKGLVDIAFDMDKTGPVTASFRYEAGGFVGEVDCDQESTRKMLENKKEALQAAVAENSDAGIDITFSWNKKIDVNAFTLSGSEVDFETVTKEEGMDKDNETQRVLTKSLYGMARAFIEELGTLY